MNYHEEVIVNAQTESHPQKLEKVLFIFYMTLLMGLAMSAYFTFQSGVENHAFVSKWLEAFISTYLVVVPVVLIVSPVAEQLKKITMKFFVGNRA